MDSSSSVASDLFNDFLACTEDPDEEALDVLIRNQPAQGPRFRRLWLNWQCARQALDGSRVDPLRPRGFRTGQIIGDFKLLEFLGEGGQGTVWEARQVSLGRSVALKLMRPDRASPRDLALFRREAQAGARLKHEGIVTVFDFGEEGHVPWIAQELVHGGRTLRDRIDEWRHAPVTPAAHYEEVARQVGRIARALHAAHEAGIIHRDIKPQNILLSREGQSKVGDFGLAHIDDVSALSETGQQVGTYLYMSPEQVGSTSSEVDHRTDIFSLGVVLYELLTLLRPFEGDTSHQVCSLILNEDPPEPRIIRSQVPRDLSVICGKAMEKNPERRYASMAEFADDIERYRAHRPILAAPPTHLQRSLKWARRHPGRSAASAVALTAMAVVSVLLWRIASDQRELLAINGDLALKTVEAQTSASAERERANEVQRLATFRKLDALESRAAQLWPLHVDLIPKYEAWLEDADEFLRSIESSEERRPGQLEGGLGHGEALDSLRSKSEIDWEEARLAHPDYPRLATLQAEILSLGRHRSVIDGSEPPAPQQLSSAHDSWTCLGLYREAKRLTYGMRTEFGREEEGFALAQLAVERAHSKYEQSHAKISLGWAYAARGQLELALSCATEVRAMSPDTEASNTQFRWMAASIEREVGATRRGDKNERLKKAQSELRILDHEIDASLPFTFDSEDDAWWHRQMTELCLRIETLASFKRGKVPLETGVAQLGVRWRIDRARKVEAASLTCDAAVAAWDDAIEAICAHAAYGGLELQPIYGLLPIGPDPESGLWEFAHLPTGTAPQRDEGGRLDLLVESGVVLVLLPGGTFHMGGQHWDAEGRNYDPVARTGESPVFEVQLSPFFMGKYELTQSVWERFTGSNPSNYAPASIGKAYNAYGRRPSTLHPVEQISRLDAGATLELMGLMIPTEAQWDYGNRGGTDTSWWPGNDPALLVDVANLNDSFKADENEEGREPWNDGELVHAPVGAFHANPFGLHDTIGNVSEWCRDGLSSLEAYGRIDPYYPLYRSRSGTIRGGSFGSRAKDARSSSRTEAQPHRIGTTRGVRPVLEFKQ